MFCMRGRGRVMNVWFWWLLLPLYCAQKLIWISAATISCNFMFSDVVLLLLWDVLCWWSTGNCGQLIQALLYLIRGVMNRLFCNWLSCHRSPLLSYYPLLLTNWLFMSKHATTMAFDWKPIFTDFLTSISSSLMNSMCSRKGPCIGMSISTRAWLIYGFLLCILVYFTGDTQHTLDFT